MIDSKNEGLIKSVVAFSSKVSSFRARGGQPSRQEALESSNSQRDYKFPAL